MTLGANSLSGTLGEFELDGARNVFTAWDEGSRAQAAQALKQWRGAYTVAWPGANGWRGLSVKVSSRGAVRAIGWTDAGVRFTVRAQLLVGERDCAAVVMRNRVGASEGSLLWFCEDGMATCESRPDGVSATLAKKSAGFAPGSVFRVDAAAVAAWVPGVQADLLPDGHAVRARAGQDLSGLRLTYWCQSGMFTGSFKVISQESGRTKLTSARVFGVIVDGKGYGLAVIGRAGQVPVTVE